MRYQYNRRSWLLAATACTLVGVTGCNTLGVNKGSLLATGQEARAGSNADTPSTGYVVQFQTDTGKPETKPMQIDGEMFMQDALEKSGAFKKYRRVTIDLVRATPSGAPHRMAVAYDRGKRRVEPQCNYHVRPGDKIIVTEDKSSVVDDMMDSLGGPFSKKKPARASVSG